MILQKTERWRSEKYLAWIREQPCCICQKTPCDAHHLKGIGNMSGTGLTAPDNYTMPLCREHHTLFHDFIGVMASEQWEWLAKTSARAIEAIAKGELEL